MTQMKGTHILAQALPGVLQQLPDAHAVFIGAGDPPAPDGRSMKDFILDQTRAVSDRVHLIDKIPHDKLYPFLRNARIAVLPSLVDNLPNTCLEAMGHGCVVLATSGSCFEQLIDHGRSGWLVPPNDVPALHEAMIHLWGLSETERAAIGQHASARIAQLHPDLAVPKLIEYYQSVIADFQKRSN